MSARYLTPDQPVAMQGGLPTRTLVEIVQRLVDALAASDARVAALEAQMGAIAAVSAPAGGGTVDTQARTAIAAIIAAAS